MADWRERVWSKFLECDGFTIGADMSHNLAKKHEDFMRIITEESAPMIDALGKENRQLKIQYDLINKLSDLKQRDIKRLQDQVEAMRLIVEEIASGPRAPLNSVGHVYRVSETLVYQAGAVIKKMKEGKDD